MAEGTAGARLLWLQHVGQVAAILGGVYFVIAYYDSKQSERFNAEREIRVELAQHQQMLSAQATELAVMESRQSEALAKFTTILQQLATVTAQLDDLKEGVKHGAKLR